MTRVSLRPKFADIFSLENGYNLQSTSFFKIILLKAVRITGERCYFSDLTCLGIHSFFISMAFFEGKGGCASYERYKENLWNCSKEVRSQHVKIGLNHAFSESQKRKKECNSYFKYKQ